MDDEAFCVLRAREGNYIWKNLRNMVLSENFCRIEAFCSLNKYKERFEVAEKC